MIRVTVRVQDEGNSARYPGIVIKADGTVQSKKQAAAFLALVARAVREASREES